MRILLTGEHKRVERNAVSRDWEVDQAGRGWSAAEIDHSKLEDGEGFLSSCNGS